MTNELIAANTVSKNPKFELSGSPPKRSVQILYTVTSIGTIVLVFGWILDEYSLSGMEKVLFVSLILQVIGMFLGADEYKYIDLETRTLIKKKWHSFMGFGGSKTPLSAFREIVVQQVCQASKKPEANFTGSVGFKATDGGPVVWVKEFSGTKDETSAELNRFAREQADITGIPYFGYPLAAL